MSLRYALSEWGASLGVGALDLPHQGGIHVQLTPDCRLSIEEVEDEVLVYLMVDMPHLDMARSLALLQACDVRGRPLHAPSVQAGLRGQGDQAQVMLLLRYRADGVQSSQLQSGLDMLLEHGRVWLGLAN